MHFQTLKNYLRNDHNLRSLLRGAGLMYIAGIITIGLTFLQQITTANLLGATEYGQLAIILGSNALILLFADFRTWEICAKLFARYQKQDDHVLLAGTVTWYLLVDLIAGLIGVLVVFLFANFIADRLVQAPDLVLDIRLFALIIPFRLVSAGVPTVILRLYNHYNWLAVKSIFYAVIRLLLMSGAAFLGFGIEGILIGAIIGEIFNTFMLLGLLIYVWRKHTDPLTPLFRFDTPQVLFDNLKTLRDLWLGGTLKGLQLETFIPLMAILSTPTQVGLYRVGLDIAQLISRIIEPISIVIQPTVIQIYEQDSKQAFIRYIRQTTVILSAIILPIVIGIIFIGPLIFPAILEDFDGVAIVVSILAIGFGFAGIATWVRPAFVALNLLYIQNILSFLGAIYIILGLFSIGYTGAIGAASIITSFLLIYNIFSILFFSIKLKSEDRIYN